MPAITGFVWDILCLISSVKTVEDDKIYSESFSSLPKEYSILETSSEFAITTGVITDSECSFKYSRSSLIITSPCLTLMPSSATLVKPLPFKLRVLIPKWTKISTPS